MLNSLIELDSSAKKSCIWTSNSNWVFDARECYSQRVAEGELVWVVCLKLILIEPSKPTPDGESLANLSNCSADGRRTKVLWRPTHRFESPTQFVVAWQLWWR